MMEAVKRFYRRYFGLCCQWYLDQKNMDWAVDFEFVLFPFLINGIKNHLVDAFFQDMSGCELAEIEQAAGQKCQPIGLIGYYYPAEVWISEHGKLSDEEKKCLKKIAQKSDLLKNPNPQRGKK